LTVAEAELCRKPSSALSENDWACAYCSENEKDDAFMTEMEVHAELVLGA